MTRTLEQFKTYVIANDIHVNASALYMSIEKDVEFDSWQNLYELDDDGEGTPVEIMEYYIVSDWLANHLLGLGEPILIDHFCVNFWGRTTTGQSIDCDGWLDALYNKIYSEK